jgi:homoserine dehydrogenase
MERLLSAGRRFGQRACSFTGKLAPMEVTKVALVGMGTVGNGVARLLIDHGDRTGRHAGRVLWVEEVVVADPKKARDFSLPKTVTLSNDLTRITRNKEIKIVAHLVGGLEPARTIMLKLLESGKDVVTANKALLAEHGPEIFDRARELGRAIAFDAAVAGGIPIITNISQCFSANQILSLRGILNGTSNFIVSQMDEQGETYAEALKEAQKRGYAEADPTMDVSGADAAQKLAILAHLAFGAQVYWNDIPRVGIDTLDAADLYYARELGYRIKLIAVAQLRESGLELHVSPNLVKIGTPLAEVRSAYNAISVVGDAVGPIFFHLGAGQMPTASAVVADMIDMAVGRTPITFRTVELWSNREARVQQCDHSLLPSRYYIRLTVEDRPGVLAEVTGVLGRNQISIASVIQHEPSEEDGGQSIVPLVIMTAQATEGATQKAMNEISKLASVRPNAVRMRVLD